jgi:sirohydrochlorin cobaltochelatase
MSESEATPIVLTVFGASSPDARKVYGEIEARMRRAYPAHEIAWAYLSLRIVEKQRRLGVTLPTLPETLQALHEAGHAEALVQPLLVVPGEEFAAVQSASCAGMRVIVGEALLSSSQDIEAALSAVAPHLAADAVNVLVCHGNKRHPEFNASLLRLKSAAEARFENLIVASVEGEPGTAPLEDARRRAQHTGKVVFIPFMIVAGEHIQKDVMGDGPKSWRSIIGANQTLCRQPLGSNEAVLDIYLRHIESALQKMQKERSNG